MRSRMLGTAAAIGTAALLLGSLGATPAVAAAKATDSACTWTKTTLPLPSGAAFGEVHATDHHGGAAGLIENDPALPDGLGSWKNGTASLDKAGAAYTTYKVIDQNSSGTYIANTTFGWVTGPIYGFVVFKDGQQLPTASTWLYDGVLDIAENGDITAWDKRGTSTSNPTTHIVRWNVDRPTEVTELGQIPGFPKNARPTDADEDGTVLYTIWSSGAKNYILRDGRAVELKKPAGLENTTADAISNGRVVGSGTYGGKSVGVLWDNDGTVTVLPNSEKTGDLKINKSGMIVGSGGNSSTDDGIPVWQLGTFVTRVGGTGDIAHTVGDDGTIGGLTVTPSGADLYPPKGTPALWRCS
ncbi:hypothetical protein ACIGO6_23855 [Streptomyces sp. NPDC053750]|uniref:hypothetical protein n=1 Tax=Streptomyces sp. NPDC053750 TaxID=3365714 RepID=UPI0037D09C64